MTRSHRCSRGHQWEAADDASLALACPMCGAASESVGADDTPGVGDELPPLPRPTGRQPAGVDDIAGYEILEELGRGGMGIVYKAHHRRLARIVAVKVILGGVYAGPDDLTRFRTEAEAVARLQHANIVQIHEVGDHNGRPFFALEYVAGGSLAHQLAGNPLPPRRAAEVVQTLARAVHHAHVKGVIHRDLKPANVLVGEGGALKVVDFGLAKRLDIDSGETRTGDVLGTPSYMAPEQARGLVREVGPLADVYALGAILYELLTGRPPFKATSTLETLQQVLANEPVPPRRLQPGVPRDLETIALACLHKAAGQRYATADELANDLERFLDGRPVKARPVGPLARGWKWARRHPARAALLALGAAATVVFVGLVLWYNAHLQRERDATLEVVKRFARISERTMLNAPGQERTRAEVLQDIVDLQEQYLRTSRGDEEFRVEYGRNLWRLGVVTGTIGSRAEGIELLRKAAAVQQELAARKPGTSSHRSDLARTYNNLGIFYRSLKKPAEAEVAWQEALRLREGLVEEFPEDPASDSFRRDLAQSLHNFGNLYRNTDRPSQAEAAYGRARDLQVLLARSHPDLSRYPEHTRYHRDLALTHQNMGGFYFARVEAPRAAAAYREALATMDRLARAHPGVHGFRIDVGQTLSLLATLMLYEGRYREAETGLRAAHEVQDKLARDFPSTLDHPHNLALTKLALGQCARATGRYTLAEAECRQALQILADLQTRRSDVPAHAFSLWNVHSELGTLLHETGRPKEADAAQRQVLQGMEGEVRKQVNAAFEPDLALVRLRLADIDLAAGRHTAAAAGYREAYAEFRRQASHAPNDTSYRADLSASGNRLGLAYQSGGRHAEAVAVWRESQGVLEALVKRTPEFAGYRRIFQGELVTTALLLAASTAPSRDSAEAGRLVQGALAAAERLVREDGEVFDHQLRLAECLVQASRLGQALERSKRAGRILRTATRQEPRHLHTRRLLRMALEAEASAWVALGKADQARRVRTELEGLPR